MQCCGEKMYRVGKVTCRRIVLIAISGFLALTATMAKSAIADKRQRPLLELGKQDGLAVDLQLMVDKARTVACEREFTEVLVANPAIADVVTISNKQLYVLGKSAGITNISLVGPDKRVLGVVQVEVAHDLRDMTQRIRELIPDGNIIVTSVKGKDPLVGHRARYRFAVAGDGNRRAVRAGCRDQYACCPRLPASASGSSLC